MAVENGNTPVVEMLISLGANVNAATNVSYPLAMRLVCICLQFYISHALRELWLTVMHAIYLYSYLAVCVLLYIAS